VIRKVSRLGVLAVFACASVVMAGPKAKVTDDTMDFGKVMQGATLTHTFWVKSVGDQKLIITKTDPGCGCTQMPIEDSVLAPGDSTPIHITLSTKGFIGNIAKRPSFETNDGTGVNYLKMFADVLTDMQMAGSVILNPPRVDVSQFTVKPRRKAKFSIVNHSKMDVNVAVVDSAFKSFDVETPKVVKAGDSAEAQIVVHEDAVKSGFLQSVTFEFTGDERIRWSLPVQRLYRPKDTTDTPNSGK
jgi:hypothetical protein